MRTSSIGLMILALVVLPGAVQAQHLGFFDTNVGQVVFVPSLPELPGTPAVMQPPATMGSVELASAFYDASPNTMYGPAVEQPIQAGAPVYSGRTYVQVDGLFWHRAGTSCSDVLALNTSSTPPRPVLDTGDPNFNVTGGVRV